MLLWSENIVDCHAENIKWTNNSLGVCFPKSKTDQMEMNTDSVWLVCHLFSNPDILSPISNDITDWVPTVKTKLIDLSNQGSSNISCKD